MIIIGLCICIISVKSKASANDGNNQHQAGSGRDKIHFLGSKMIYVGGQLLAWKEAKKWCLHACSKLSQKLIFSHTSAKYLFLWRVKRLLSCFNLQRSLQTSRRARESACRHVRKPVANWSVSVAGATEQIGCLANTWSPTLSSVCM